MPWQREAKFKEVLDKAVKKGSKGAIATVQKIALEDMGQVGLTVTTAHADHSFLSVQHFLFPCQVLCTCNCV
jgi:hypothetical protein